MAGPPYSNFQIIDASVVTPGVNFTGVVLDASFNPSDNRIRTLTSGGSGFRGIAGSGGGGGGSGMLCEAINQALTPGSILTGRVGIKNGTPGASGTGATWLGGTSLAAAFIGGQGAGNASSTFGGGIPNATGAKGVKDAGHAGAGNSGGNGVGRGGGGGGAPGWDGISASPTAPTNTDGTDGAAANGGLVPGGTKGTAVAAATAGTSGTPPVYAGGGGGGASTTNKQGGAGGKYGSGGGGGYDGAGTDADSGGGLILLEWNVATDTVAIDETRFATRVAQISPIATGTAAQVLYTLNISGTDAANVNSAEVQLTNETGGGVEQTWTALTSFINTGTVVSGYLSVPKAAKMYISQARTKKGAGTLVATSPTSTLSIGAGVVMQLSGSSTNNHMNDSDVTDVAASPRTFHFDGATTITNSGQGNRELANRVSAYHGGCPVLIIGSSIGGSLLADWQNAASTEFTTAVAAVAATIIGKLEAEFLNCGSGDARLVVSPGTGLPEATTIGYKQNLMANFRTALGQSTLPMFWGQAQTSPKPGQVDAPWTAERGADIANDGVYANCWLAAATYNRSIGGDGVHMDAFAAGSYTYLGACYARKYAQKALGLTLDADGATHVATAYNDATGDWTFTYDLPPGTTATGLVNNLNNGTYGVDPTMFQCYDAAMNRQTMTAAVIISTTQAKVSGPAGLTRPVKGGYATGAWPGQNGQTWTNGVATTTPNCLYINSAAPTS